MSLSASGIRNFIRPGHIPTPELKARYNRMQTALQTRYTHMQTNDNYIQKTNLPKIQAQAKFLIEQLELNFFEGRTKKSAKKLLNMIFKGLDKGLSRGDEAFIDEAFKGRVVPNKQSVKNFTETYMFTKPLLTRINNRIVKLFKKYGINLMTPSEKQALYRTSRDLDGINLMTPSEKQALYRTSRGLDRTITLHSSNSTVNSSPVTDLEFHLPDYSPTDLQHSTRPADEPLCLDDLAVAPTRKRARLTQTSETSSINPPTHKRARLNLTQEAPPPSAPSLDSLEDSHYSIQANKPLPLAKNEELSAPSWDNFAPPLSAPSWDSLANSFHPSQANKPLPLAENEELSAPSWDSLANSFHSIHAYKPLPLAENEEFSASSWDDFAVSSHHPSLLSENSKRELSLSDLTWAGIDRTKATSPYVGFKNFTLPAKSQITPVALHRPIYTTSLNEEGSKIIRKNLSHNSDKLETILEETPKTIPTRPNHKKETHSTLTPITGNNWDALYKRLSAEESNH